jgi:hypothetical protein
MEMKNEAIALKPEEKLEQMASNARAEVGDHGFMNPGAKRRGRGRPRGSKNGAKHVDPHGDPAGPIDQSLNENRQQVDPIQELMPLTHGLASFYSNFLVRLAEDERARLTKEKSDIIAHTSAVCLNQYFPGALGSHASAIVLGVTVLETSMVAIALRKENLEKLREEYKRKKQAESQNQPPPPARPNGQTSMEGFQN